MKPWVKYLIAVILLVVGFQQAMARSKNIGIAEEKVRSAAVLDSMALVHINRADSVAVVALDLNRVDAIQAQVDSIRIRELQRNLRTMTVRSVALGDELEVHLDSIAPQLADQFREFQDMMEGRLVVSQEETNIERLAKERALLRANTWEQTATERLFALEDREAQIVNLNAGIEAALAAANAGGFSLDFGSSLITGAVAVGGIIVGVLITR